MHRGSCLVVIALLALALTVSACGRRGQLERPAAAGVGASGQTTDPAPEKPDRPFILDGLLRLSMIPKSLPSGLTRRVGTGFRTSMPSGPTRGIMLKQKA